MGTRGLRFGWRRFELTRLELVTWTFLHIPAWINAEKLTSPPAITILKSHRGVDVNDVMRVGWFYLAALACKDIMRKIKFY